MPESNLPAQRWTARAPWALIAAAVLLRVVWLVRPTTTHVDEGGWPLAVRDWAVDGMVTFDFFKAPFYHLVLGAALRIGPPTLVSARVLSLLLGLLSLWLLYRLVLRLGRSQQEALWATAFWACCFPAADLSGRALIEPLQLALILALVLAMLHPGAAWRRAALTALATAALLLTKANAVVLLPALGAALWWERQDALPRPRRAVLGGMALGVTAALAAFGALYLWDPETFRYAWSTTAQRPDVATPSGALRLGRFVFDPRQVESAVEFLASQTPFLFVLGTLAALRALMQRAGSLPALSLLAALAFVLVQADQPPQYFAMIYPWLAVGTASLLSPLLATVAERRWVFVAALLIALDGLARTGAAIALLPAAERTGIEWARQNIPADEGLVAAPYLLMQLEQPGTTVFDVTDFRSPPSDSALDAAGASWLLVDAAEWESYVADRTADVAAHRDALLGCCELRYADAALRIYRRRD